MQNVPEGLPALFSMAWIQDEQLHVPAGPATVVFDLSKRTASGPGPTGQPTRLALDELKQFSIGHREQQGDTKTHHFYTVYLEDAQGQVLCLEERVKEYDEFHPDVQAEMLKTRAAIHALPGLLGLKAEMAHPEYAPEDPRGAYSTKPSGLFREPKAEPSSQSREAAGDWKLGLAMLGVMALFFLWWRRRD